VLRLVAALHVSASQALVAVRREEGQTMAEYGVVLAVITLLSGNVRTALTSVANILPGG
jgi:Flp pilus assembly pilin Flp